MDSNGDLTISGGEVYVDGPTNGGNGALDYDGNGTITGGTVVMVGSNGMAMGLAQIPSKLPSLKRMCLVVLRQGDDYRFVG